MKILIGAIALTLAVPAFAQAAPPADPHAEHESKAKHDCKKCCEKMKGKDGKMDCMKDEAEKAGSAQQQHQGHGEHAH